MPQINYTETLTVVSCTCGINFAIPETLHAQMLDHRGPGGKSCYCPLGHKWHFVGKTDAQVAREEAAAARRREQAVRELLSQEERSHTATKGHLTRVRKRVAHGVCPHCNRSFPNLEAHMHSKHPEEQK